MQSAVDVAVQSPGIDYLLAKTAAAVKPNEFEIQPVESTMGIAHTSKHVCGTTCMRAVSFDIVSVVLQES
jgi:hypothetical protein